MPASSAILAVKLKGRDRASQCVFWRGFGDNLEIGAAGSAGLRFWKTLAFKMADLK